MMKRWNSNTDKLTDYDLYGMDAEEYLKKQVGKDYYNVETTGIELKRGMVRF